MCLKHTQDDGFPKDTALDWISGADAKFLELEKRFSVYE